MEIKKKYLSKYLHDIAIDQIAEEYIQKGYSVNKEERIGEYEADLILRKGNEQIVIEVKAGRLTSERKEQIAKMADYVSSLGNYRFLVVIATPPKEKTLEILEIEELLFNYFLEEFPDELMELSTHTSIEEIIDVDIDEIKINGTSILIKGDGVANVQLQFGSDGDQERDDGYKTNDNYPFDFKLTLGYDEENVLSIIEIDKLKFDTSAFYE